MAFMKAEPWKEIVPSKVGGGVVRSDHLRTVASREAERTRFGLGNTTPRTCMHALASGRTVRSTTE